MLKIFVNRVSLVENEEYNNIKLSIIEYEENIKKEKKQKNKNSESLKLLNKSIIEIIGAFLIKIEERSNLYISFIKYYFNKICEFYQSFKVISDNDKNDFKNIQENIKLILEKIHFFNPELIFEIIEEFVDLDSLYKSFIDFILISYWDKANHAFYSSSYIMKEKKNNRYKSILKELKETINLVDICKELMNKFNLNSNTLIIII